MKTDYENGTDLQALAGEQVDPTENATSYSKLDCAKIYANNGFSIFPCVPNGKNPAFKWKDYATTDIDVIEKWWTDNPEYNIGVVADNHIVLDVDTKSDSHTDGYTSLKNHPEFPETFTVTTPSGGRHYYFDTDDPQSLTIATGFENGLDIRAGGKGYTIGVGSTIDGVSYTSTSESFYMAPAPDWVKLAAEKPKPKADKPMLRVNRSNHNLPSLAEIKRVLNATDPDEGYDSWHKIGMAIHSAYPGIDGLQVWDDWSSGGEKYIVGECAKHWNGFEDDGGITLGTLFHFAKKENAVSKITNSLGFVMGTNDTTIAEAFVGRHGANIIYDTAHSQWRVFDDGYWRDAEDAKKLVIDFYKGIVKDLPPLIKHEDFLVTENPDRWINKAMNGSTQNAVLRIVRDRLGEDIKNLDSNADLIGIQDMVYEISTSVARKAEAKDRVFKSLGTQYDPSATCPQWESFLVTVMQEDTEMISYLQRLVGYFLTASIEEQEIYYFYGSGANGKSTFIDLVKALLGNYSVKIMSDAVVKSRFGERSNTTLSNLAKLAGARLALTDEMGDSNVVFDTQTLKSISGDAETNGRFMYANAKDFMSTAKLVMYGNDKPYGNINDEGFWRRLRFIHFRHVIPAGKRDKGLLNKLKAEMPGILNWALKGLEDWQEHGLHTPQQIMHDCAGYRMELDTVTEFLDSNVIIGGSNFVSSKSLFDEYQKWCQDNLALDESAQGFSRKANAYFQHKQGVEYHKTSKSRGYKGVTLV